MLYQGKDEVRPNNLIATEYLVYSLLNYLLTPVFYQGLQAQRASNGSERHRAHPVILLSLSAIAFARAVRLQDSPQSVNNAPTDG